MASILQKHRKKSIFGKNCKSLKVFGKNAKILSFLEMFCRNINVLASFLFSDPNKKTYLRTESKKISPDCIFIEMMLRQGYKILKKKMNFSTIFSQNTETR